MWWAVPVAKVCSAQLCGPACSSSRPCVSSWLQAASEDELRYALGLSSYTTGKGKVDMKDTAMRPIEVFMCSVVSGTSCSTFVQDLGPKLAADVRLLQSLNCWLLPGYPVTTYNVPCCRCGAWAMAMASDGLRSTSSDDGWTPTRCGLDVTGIIGVGWRQHTPLAAFEWS